MRGDVYLYICVLPNEFLEIQRISRETRRKHMIPPFRNNALITHENYVNNPARGSTISALLCHHFQKLQAFPRSRIRCVFKSFQFETVFKSLPVQCVFLTDTFGPDERMRIRVDVAYVHVDRQRVQQTLIIT